jgi:hypothetical protein
VHVNEKTPRAGKLIECPFDVKIDGVPYDRFYDVRDALAVARAIKRKNPSAAVVVTDTTTSKLVIDIPEN